MIRVTRFSPEHYEKIIPRACHNVDHITGVAKEAITLLRDDVPLAILGWEWISKGVLQVFAIISDEIKKCPLVFHKTVLGLLNNEFEVKSVRRVQMSVVVGYQMGWKWAKALGFECEGIMRGYCPDGSDAWLFARVNS